MFPLFFFSSTKGSEEEKSKKKDISSQLFVQKVEMEKGETDWLIFFSFSSWVAQPLMLYRAPYVSALILEKKVSGHIRSLLRQFVKIHLVSRGWQKPFRGS